MEQILCGRLDCWAVAHYSVIEISTGDVAVLCVGCVDLLSQAHPGLLDGCLMRPITTTTHQERT